LRGSSADGFEAVWRSNGHHPEIEDVVAASVETRPVDFLWRGRIPKGKLTIADGDPGEGKSVVSMDLAARVSTGRCFPDGAPCEVGNVLIANVEDGIDDTIVPRLKAHGADLDRVFIFSSVPDGKGGTRLLNLPDDIVLLENKVLQREAALLIIDPVMTMLGGDANKDQDARKALAPIRDMAEQTGVAVVAVRHLNKSVGLKAIQRGGGNMGLIGVARAGLFFAEHPDDDRLRVMAVHKSNLAERPPSLSYEIVSSEIHNTARVEWVGVTDHDANSLAAGGMTPHEKSVLDEAVAFLRDELGDGPVMAKQVFKDARDAGVTEITLRRAKTALRVRSERQGTEGWAWRLPEDDHPPSGDDGKEYAERGDDRGGEDEHNPAAAKDDRVDHDDHLGHIEEDVSENPASLLEDDQDDHDDHDDPLEHDHHDHLGDGNGHALTLRESNHHRPSADEEARIKRLIGQGMSPNWARAEVLGDEVRDQVERELASQEDAR
jgi:AAA domain